MGNCASQADQDEKAKSLAIDKQIEEDSKKFKKDCKILLLGTSTSLSPSGVQGLCGPTED